MQKGTHGGDAIDCCAAPGNKTSHLAASMASKGDKGKIYAFEKDPKRCKILGKRMIEAGARNVFVTLADYLQVDTKSSNYNNVRTILLDPSCSGSGMSHRIDHAVDATADSETEASRLKSLSNFQYTALIHAMSFPRAERITYSTCSVHDIENENVVAEALSGQPEPASPDVGKWELKKALPSWTRRGNMHKSLTKEQSEALVRAVPEDGTNGFFVAYFERSMSLKKDLIKVNRNRKRNEKRNKRKAAAGRNANDGEGGDQRKKQKV